MTRVFCPYNEKLPKNSAHDVYVYRQAWYLSAYTDLQIILATGRPQVCGPDLFHHYTGQYPETEKAFQNSLIEDELKTPLKCLSPKLEFHNGNFHHISFPLLRKSGWLRTSWNWPFFLRCQKYIEKTRPDWVFLSVLKQAAFHLSKKVPSSRYCMEVHELGYYPPFDPQTFEPKWQNEHELQEITRNNPRIGLEKRIFSDCHQIIVTTSVLKEILQNPPYNIFTPIKVVHLASHYRALENKNSQTKRIRIAYVGQLYESQGVQDLIHALARVEDLYLEIIGGTPKQLETLKKLVHHLSLNRRVHFHGFIHPGQIQSIIHDIDAFIAPFHLTSHMCSVAHTKLIDYDAWNKPIIAPDIPHVREILENRLVGFAPHSYPKQLRSLANTLNHFKENIEKFRYPQPSPDHSWKKRIQTIYETIT